MKTFIVLLLVASIFTLGNGQILATMGDEVWALEGATGGTAVLQFPVYLSQPVTTTSTVTFSIVAGTASQGVDYRVPLETTVTFLAGSDEELITVPLVGDEDVEATETFQVLLGVGTGVTVSFPFSSQGYIVNDDGVGATLSADSSTREAFAFFNFTVTIESAQAHDVSFMYRAFSKSTDTATPGVDYDNAVSEVVIPAGSTSAYVEVTIFDDSNGEVDETLTLRIYEPNQMVLKSGGATVVVIDQTITIEDDDILLTVSDVESTEGTGTNTDFVFTVALSQALGAGESASVQLTLVHDTTDATDFADVSGLTTLNFVAGEQSKTVTVTVNGDTDKEEAELFEIHATVISSVPFSMIQTGFLSIGTGTIVNDDSNIVLTLAEQTAHGPVVLESIGNLVFVVSVAGSNTGGPSGSYRIEVSDGTAISSIDYTTSLTSNDLLLATQTISWAAGATPSAFTFTVSILEDSFLEAVNENFFIRLVELSSASATVDELEYFIDDDTLIIQISDAVSVSEGGVGSTTQLLFPIILNRGTTSALTLSLEYDTSVDSLIATPATDFVGPSSHVLASGVTSSVLTVVVNGDSDFELDETVKVVITGVTPNNAIIEIASAEGVILNDDIPIYVHDVQVLEGTGSINTNAVVRLFSPVPFPAGSSISWFTQVGSAGASDFISIPSTTKNLPVGLQETTITVQIVADSELEGPETFTIQLQGGTLVSPGTPSFGTVTILNDDGPLLSCQDVSALESSGSIVFTLSIANSIGVDASVLVSTGNLGSALPTTDFTVVTDHLVTFTAGTTTATFTVTLVNDALNEATETFTLRFGSSTNLHIPTTLVPVGRIVNDDGIQFGFLNSASFSLPEGTGTTTNFVFVIGPTGAPASVPAGASVIFETIDGTAIHDEDYVSISNTEVALGLTPVTVTVTVFADSNKEPTEDFQVRLFWPDFVSFGSPATIDLSATVNILGDDFFANITGFQENEGDLGDPATLFIFDVEFDGPASQGSTLTYRTFDGTALAANNDYVAHPSTTIPVTAGSTGLQITVTVNPDNLPEDDEHFTVELTGAFLLNVGTPKVATGTIVNDDFTLAVVEKATFEGDTASRDVIFTYYIDGPAVAGAQFRATTVDGTAIAGTDYVSFDQIVPITEGAEEVNITVTILGDTIPEVSKEFTILFTAPDNILLSASSSTITILGDDGPELSVVGSSVLEGNSTASQVTFVITASAPVVAGAGFFITTSNLDTEDGDFVAVTTNTFVGFTAGATTVTVTVLTTPDTIAEDTESFLLVITSPAFTSFAPEVTSRAITAEGEIINDDGLGVSIVNVVIPEGTSDIPSATKDFVITASLVGGVAPFEASVSFNVVPGTAQLGTDYMTESGVISWPQNSASTTFTVAVLADMVEEGQETFTVTLHTPNNVNIQGYVPVTVTISNDDSILVIENAEVIEGKLGTTTHMVFNVSLSSGSPAPPTHVSFNWATSPLTATAPSDYVAATGTFNFAAGQTEGQISIVVNGDDENEFDEMFHLLISNVQNAIIDELVVNGTILTDDVLVNVVDDAFYEGDSTYIYSFPLIQTTVSPNIATVTYAVVDGTAVHGVDFNLLSPTTIVLSENDTRVYVEFEILGNTVVEASGDKSFTVQLVSCVGCGIGSSSTAVVTLWADDYTIAFETSSVEVDETESTFDVTLNILLSNSINTAGPSPMVTVETVDASALDGEDYTARATMYTFANGDSSATFTVPILGDTVSENDEHFIVRLVSPAGLKLGSPDSTQVVILDNDARLVRVSHPRSVEGGDSRTFQEDVNLYNLTFVVSLSGPAPANASVTYATQNGSATPDVDYIPVAGTYDFTVGEMSFEIDVQILSDFDLEESESLWLRILSFTGDLKLDEFTDGKGTIVNDDYKGYAIRGVVRGEFRVNNRNII